MKRISSITASKRLIYSIQLAFVILLGLFSRSDTHYLPEIFKQYGGDILWALALYSLISLFSIKSKVKYKSIISIAIALLVEISQLFHPQWLDSLRKIKMFGLILGFGFLWSDLICYAIGIAIGVLIDLTIHKRH